jgi:hypothetical protein
MLWESFGERRCRCWRQGSQRDTESVRDFNAHHCVDSATVWEDSITEPRGSASYLTVPGLDVSNSTVTCGQVDVSDSTVTGGQVDVSDSTVTGGQVDVSDSTVTRGQVDVSDSTVTGQVNCDTRSS